MSDKQNEDAVRASLSTDGFGTDLEQVIYALERSERYLASMGETLWSKGDYSAEFYTEDAARMREAIALIRSGTGEVKRLREALARIVRDCTARKAVMIARNALGPNA